MAIEPTWSMDVRVEILCRDGIPAGGLVGSPQNKAGGTERMVGIYVRGSNVGLTFAPSRTKTAVRQSSGLRY